MFIPTQMHIIACQFDLAWKDREANFRSCISAEVSFLQVERWRSEFPALLDRETR